MLTHCHVLLGEGRRVSIGTTDARQSALPSLCQFRELGVGFFEGTLLALKRDTKRKKQTNISWGPLSIFKHTHLGASQN